MNQGSHMTRQLSLRFALLRLRANTFGQRFYLCLRKPRKELQISGRVAIIAVQPELIKAIWRSQFWIEPDRASFGLAKLHTGRGGHQRKYQAVRLCASQSANQIDPGDDVAPLIAATHLQSAAVPVVQDKIIVGLQ